LSQEAFDRLINAPASAKSPGQVPTGKFPLPAAPLQIKPTAAGRVTGALITLAVWGGLAYLVVKAARGIRGR
jgi:hypothetical protein